MKRQRRGYGIWEIGGAAGAVKGETLENCKVEAEVEGRGSRAVGDLAEVGRNLGGKRPYYGWTMAGPFVAYGFLALVGL